MNAPSNISHLSSYERQQQPRTTMRRPGPAAQQDQPFEPRKKFVAKGHDSQLQQAQFSKALVEITTMGEVLIKGTISRRDKFTVTLRLNKGVDAGKELIIYKHAIESILIHPVEGSEENRVG